VSPETSSPSAAGTIAYGRPDPNWEIYSAFLIDPDGSHEAAIAGGSARWSWIWAAHDTKLLVSVGDTWARPAVVNQDGSDLAVLDAYPDRTMHLSPVAWSADGSRILVASGAPAPHPDRPDANLKDRGLYTIRASDGGDLRRVSSNPDRSLDVVFGYAPDGSRIFVSREPWGLQDAQDLPPAVDNERSLFVIKAAGGSSRRLSPTNLNVFGVDWWPGASSDLSPDGTMVAFAAGPIPNPDDVPNTVFLVNADGTGLHQLVAPEVGGITVRWSPDGTRLAFTSKLRSGAQLWVVNADGTRLTQVTDGADGSVSVMPVWSPDGTTLLYERQLGNEVTLRTIRVDGTGDRQLTTPFGDFIGGYVWGMGPGG
jgi:Tol biopolymer transport system component